MNTGDSTPASPRSRIRVLCVTRQYPNAVFPRLGLWTERLVEACPEDVDVAVVAPVPYWPPLPGPAAYARFRQVPAAEQRGGTPVLHPRFLAGPGHSLHVLEGWPYSRAIRRAAAEVRRQFPFDLIHAHGVYPDGWAAARLARRCGVPLVITELASWRPWLDRYPAVRRRALEAAAQSAFVIAVSHPQREAIIEVLGEASRVRVIPNVVDASVFTLPRGGAAPSPDRLLFVGLIRRVKGLDVLLHALRVLRDRGRDVQLDVVGDAFYEAYRRDYEAVRRLVRQLGLEPHVALLGGRPPAGVALAMQRCAALVLPSRRETFGVVLAEALACGTPVVATRCGGPEDFVSDAVGALVPPEDPAALASGIERVLDRRAAYRPEALRAFTLARFGREPVGAALRRVYADALAGAGRPQEATAPAADATLRRK